MTEELVQILEMKVDHYEVVRKLWDESKGIGLSDADSKINFSSFLERNPGLSLVAMSGKRLLGAILCGHDGRRGYLHHLAVMDDFRRRGIGNQLVDTCLSKLNDQGIQKSHLFVFGANRDAISFWREIGWTERVELIVMSKYTNR